MNAKRKKQAIINVPKANPMEKITRDDDLLLLKKYYLCETTATEDQAVRTRLQKDEDFREKAQLYRSLLWTVERWEIQYVQAHEAGELKQARQEKYVMTKHSMRVFWIAASVVFLCALVWWNLPTASPEGVGKNDIKILQDKQDTNQKEPIKSTPKPAGRCADAEKCIAELAQEQDETKRKELVDALLPAFDAVRVVSSKGNQVGIYTQEKGNLWIGIDKIGDHNYKFVKIEGRKLILQIRL